MSTAFLSPRDLAAAIGVSESSLKRWVDSGRLTVERTAGGHRRIPLQEAVRFVRSEGYRVQDPSCFGVLCTARAEQSGELGEALYEGLLAGDAERCRALISTAYLTGTSAAALCDGPLRAALCRLGELWKHGDDGIAAEHCATSICMQIVEHLRQFQAAPGPEAPVALGGGTDSDPYVLPSQMAGVVLGECGYRTLNLGPCTSNQVLLSAVQKFRPVLVWRSLSAIGDAEACARGLRELAQQLGDTPLVVGGKQFPLVANAAGRHLQVVGTMCELAAFARALVLRRKAPPA